MGDVTISPVSMASVLSMIRTGAFGETRRNWPSARGRGPRTDRGQPGLADLITAAQSGKKTSVTVWNSLWLRKDIPSSLPSSISTGSTTQRNACR